jgi:hypothetical protein
VTVTARHEAADARQDNHRGRWGWWWIPDEAPGGIGGPELWMDSAALDSYGHDGGPLVTVSPASPGTWIDALVRFSGFPGLEAPCVYIVDVRRTSGANLNRPYYVLKQPG